MKAVNIEKFPNKVKENSLEELEKMKIILEKEIQIKKDTINGVEDNLEEVKSPAEVLEDKVDEKFELAQSIRQFLSSNLLNSAHALANISLFEKQSDLVSQEMYDNSKGWIDENVDAFHKILKMNISQDKFQMAIKLHDWDDVFSEKGEYQDIDFYKEINASEISEMAKEALNKANDVYTEFLQQFKKYFDWILASLDEKDLENFEEINAQLGHYIDTFFDAWSELKETLKIDKKLNG